MSNFVKYAVVGIAGYFIGFYEFKYKAMKAMTSILINEKENEKNFTKEE